MSPVIELDEATHTYRVDGIVRPSVTQIIAPLYDWSGIDPAVLAFAAQRGTAVHKAIELDCRNDLDEETIDPAIVPYLAAWRRFVAESGWHSEDVERRLYSHTHKFCGTVDQIGSIGMGTVGVLDVKTGMEHPAHAIQTFGYLTAANDCAIPVQPVRWRASIYLSDDGRYRLLNYGVTQLARDADALIFHSCLTINRWRTKHAINN